MEVYRGSEYCLDLLPKSQIDMVVQTEDVERIVRTILETAETGNIGDGKYSSPRRRRDPHQNRRPRSSAV